MNFIDKLRKSLKIKEDIDLCYYEDGIGKTVIMLHGNGMESRGYKKMFKKLSEKFHVIAIDTRAHGFSAKGHERFSIELFADDIIEFLKIKNIESTSVIGFSDGANIGLWIGKKNQEIIEKLVLISGNYKGSGVYNWFRIILKAYKKILTKFKKIKSIKERYELVDIMICDIGVTEEDLKNINVDTLVLCASFDVIDIEHSKELSRNLKKSEFRVIKKSSHMNIFKNDKAIKEILNFLV